MEYKKSQKAHQKITLIGWNLVGISKKKEKEVFKHILSYPIHLCFIPSKFSHIYYFWQLNLNFYILPFVPNQLRADK